ncbi:hypothetical protein [Terracidiphilus sp.]|uniref:hypothetical protein n=1 Tax=Terracidiphilus sp. TaxID=1964191 RepID=UPI003C15A97F
MRTSGPVPLLAAKADFSMRLPIPLHYLARTFCAAVPFALTRGSRKKASSLAPVKLWLYRAFQS